MSVNEPTRLWEYVSYWAAQKPDAEALVFEGTTLTYAALNKRANRLAHVLRARGAKPGTPIGLCSSRSEDLLIGALGILKAGGAYVPLDPAYPADRIAHYISDSAAPIIVTQSALAGQLPPHSAQVLEIDSDPNIVAASEDNPDATARMLYARWLGAAVLAKLAQSDAALRMAREETSAQLAPSGAETTD